MFNNEQWCDCYHCYCFFFYSDRTQVRSKEWIVVNIFIPLCELEVFNGVANRLKGNSVAHL